MPRLEYYLYRSGMRGDENRVIDAYVTWLERSNWTVRREVDFVDVYAERGDERLYAEAKGRTTSPGLDVDTLYGQLLRRMKDPKPGARYSVVVPTDLCPERRIARAGLGARPPVNRCLRGRRRRRRASAQVSVARWRA
jgi:hypothetical protein